MDIPGLYVSTRQLSLQFRNLLPQCTRQFSRWMQELKRVCHYIQYVSEPRLTQTVPYEYIDIIVTCLLNLWNSTTPEDDSLVSLLMHCRSVFFMYLKFHHGVRFSWKVRQEAALILRDVAVYYENDDVLKELALMHDEALDIYRSAKLAKTLHPLAMEYEDLSQGNRLSFKLIQCNAALVSGDQHWLHAEPPSRRAPRMFHYANAPSTPVAPPSSESADEDCG